MPCENQAIGQYFGLELTDALDVSETVSFGSDKMINGGPSTKECTHERRNKDRSEPTINFTGDMICKTRKDHFLANKKNKQKLINLIGSKLDDQGCKVLHGEGDADLLIIQTAVEASRSQDVIVIGEDTDLLVLLIHHIHVESCGIFFRSERKQTAKKMVKVWDIKALKRDIEEVASSNILFCHAILGCDTTSVIFGIGKGTALKIINKDERFREYGEVFKSESASKSEIEAAGQAALVALYGGGPSVDIDSLRHEKFLQKVSTSTVFVHPQVLPPTASATKYLSYRVYHQVQEWQGRAGLNPVEWGWTLIDGHLSPTMMGLPPAPSVLLNVIRCNCKGDCSGIRCSCRKHRLDCTLACGECKGLSCANSPQPDFDDV